MKTTLRYSSIAILIISAILVGCTPKTPPTSTPVTTEAPVIYLNPGGTSFVIPQLVSQTIQLDPATAEDTDTLALSSLLYDGLVKLDESGNPQPALAVSWTISDDQLDYVMSLRQDVTFHSGTPFNADAVLANLNRWFDPQDPLHGNKTYAGWDQYFLGFKGDFDASGVAISPFDGVEKVDEQTILVHLNRPVPDLLVYLAQPYFAIIDPTILEAGVDTLGTSAESVSGTGAYTLSAWTESGLTLTPNANYWGTVPTDELSIGWK